MLLLQQLHGPCSLTKLILHYEREPCVYCAGEAGNALLRQCMAGLQMTKGYHTVGASSAFLRP